MNFDWNTVFMIYIVHIIHSLVVRFDITQRSCRIEQLIPLIMLQVLTLLFYNCNFKIKYCFLSLAILVSLDIFAQPKADFIASTASGCSPLVVSFTNTSTDVSNNAKYQWDFGNSNSSTNKDAATTYTSEQVFTVTLTVIDNNISSSKSMTINVFKSPVPSFIVNNTIGCPPFNATFSSTSSSGSGTTVYYYWDFGDGHTINGDTSSQIVNHSYNSTGVYTVKLQVKTNTGCATTLTTKSNLINVQVKPVAAYVRSKNYLCNPVGEEISFSNNSSTVQGTTYLWKFGDGLSSTEISPSHTYNRKGTYSDSLIVTNASGCKDTTFSATPIFSSSFQSNFDIPNIALCTGNNISLNNSSNPIPDMANWYFSGQMGTISGINTSKIFNKPGTYSIKLVNQFGTCLDSIFKKITIVQGITLAGFTASLVPLCAGKTLVTLTDTSKHNNSLWNLQGSQDTLNTNPVNYTFSHDSVLNFSLTVSNPLGCSATAVKSLSVKHLPITIKAISDGPKNGLSGCKGLKVKFSAVPSTNIGSYLWNFGDSNSSSDSVPTHSFDSVGTFTIKLNYTTLDGCNDTTSFRRANALNPLDY